MSVAGIDFGSHLSSVALWFPEKNSLEVMADDLGSRNIPSAVAYRGEEIVTSQAAITQQYKNPSNTFDDVRSLLTNKSIQTVTVPALEKEISVQELASHFFRNIHNQIKQQVGHAVRDCVVSIPVDYDDEIKQRITESAQAGGMRIKSFILDSTAAIMSQELDDFSKTSSRILVVDIGWTLTTVTVYDVSGGVFVKIAAVDNKDVCGSKFVQLMADHCAKEFQRKNKFPCADNKRAMTRLKRECEVAMKSLSTGAEATIDLDSLCEGADYSSRLSKARFEDLLTIPFMHLKNTINSIFAAASIEGTSIEKICLSGGPSAIPKVVSTVKALLPHAELLKSRFEYSEVSCVGAALQARHLLELGLIDKPPKNCASVACLDMALLIDCGNGEEPKVILPAKSCLPASCSVKAKVTATNSHLSLIVAADNGAQSTTVGDVVVSLQGSDVNEEVSINVNISLEGEMKVEVIQLSTSQVVGALILSAV